MFPCANRQKNILPQNTKLARRKGWERKPTVDRRSVYICERRRRPRRTADIMCTWLYTLGFWGLKPNWGASLRVEHARGAKSKKVCNPQPSVVNPFCTWSLAPLHLTSYTAEPSLPWNLHLICTLTIFWPCILSRGSCSSLGVWTFCCIRPLRRCLRRQECSLWTVDAKLWTPRWVPIRVSRFGWQSSRWRV